MTEIESEALIRLATETLKTCRAVIEGLTAKATEPKLVGLMKAGVLVDRSPVWLRRKLEAGELTGYQTGRGGNWQIDPTILVEELKANLYVKKVPKKRQRKTLAL